MSKEKDTLEVTSDAEGVTVGSHTMSINEAETLGDAIKEAARHSAEARAERAELERKPS